MPETKRCGKCRRTLPRSQFTKHKQQKDGLHPNCRNCRKNESYVRLYGITVQDYERMFEEQGGVCKLCGRPEWIVDNRTGITNRLCVDHDHETGRIRGLLCRRCNYLIGHLESVDVEWLRAAWRHLNG